MDISYSFFLLFFLFIRYFHFDFFAFYLKFLVFYLFHHRMNYHLKCGIQIYEILIFQRSFQFIRYLDLILLKIIQSISFVYYLRYFFNPRQICYSHFYPYLLTYEAVLECQFVLMLQIVQRLGHTVLIFFLAIIIADVIFLPLIVNVFRNL